MAKIDWRPLSPKSVMSLAPSDAFIRIWEGAVRSSKTVASIIAWIDFVSKSPHRDFLMTGKTADTLYRNVLDGELGLLNIMGEGRASYRKSAQGGAKLTLKLPDPNTGEIVEKTCYCLGMNDERAEGNIRGMTIAGWYADEVTLYPESGVKQAINRMSLDGAQAFWTCNPDSPYHYIYTEFIEQAADKGYDVWHFELDDNYALSERYKDNLKRAYTGLWYDRMILGLWVMADGIIYDMFNEKKHVIPTEDRVYSDYWIAMDYGTYNPTTMGLWGLCQEGEYAGRWIKIKEYFYNGREDGQKDDSEYYEDLVEFIGELEDSINGIIIDPSASSFIAMIESGNKKRRMQGKSSFVVYKAINDVVDGIRRVSTSLQMGDILYNDCCKETVREFYSYSWCPRASKRGEDKPLEENDHCMDSDRYFVNTVFGMELNKERKNYSGKGVRR